MGILLLRSMPEHTKPKRISMQEYIKCIYESIQLSTAFGGGGGNWTRVRKYCHKNFYKFSLYSFFAYSDQTDKVEISYSVKFSLAAVPEKPPQSILLIVARYKAQEPLQQT